MKTNFDSAQKFIEMKRSHEGESLSGPGSYKAVTSDVVNFIDQTIKKYKIKSILDLGCGDWNWFSTVDLSNCSYTGWDADSQMIRDNQSKYANELIQFHVKDIVTEPLPNVDLIICRDVLFHIKLELSMPLVERITETSKYFISTCFRSVASNSDIKKYCNIENWGWFPINLNIAPFNLINREIEYKHETKIPTRNDHKRYMSLYKCKG